MTKLILPLLLKTDIVLKHKIRHILSFTEENKIITGSKNGEIIIWKKNMEKNIFEAKLFLTPCLNQTIGSVKCMQILKNPIQNLTVLRFKKFFILFIF